MLGSSRFHKSWQILHGRRACPLCYWGWPCHGLQNLFREGETSSTCKLEERAKWVANTCEDVCLTSMRR